MSARPVSSDPRSQRSRQQIFAAMHSQARAGELTSISSLSESAGITRATFYNHFDTFEEAAWFAILDSFDHLIAQAFERRDEGIELAVAAIENLRTIVELLRAEPQLFHLADSYDNGSDLRGIAEIIRVQNRIVWVDSGDDSATAEVEITYAAAGLYAVLSMGARSEDDAGEIARVAHSLLPDWMRQANRN
ncbi:TetR/AcrR family transcriptional regulator [Cryobacterium arcticum]|nr:hypothetical protein [Cryobacterium arcticum]